MALHGSAAANLSPILFKGSNISLGLNVILHLDESGSMRNVVELYANGSIIGDLQEAFLAKKIGNRIESFPNVYAFFSTFSRNASSAFTIKNSFGTLNVSQSFIRGEENRATTVTNWTTKYYNNTTNQRPNICTLVPNNTTSGRLSGVLNSYPGAISEDVHGNIWSIFTTPNAISTGTPGRYGSVIGSPVRNGATTIVITASNEQSDFWNNVGPNDLTNVLVDVPGGKRTINGANGELLLRKYRIVALSSYKSTDNFDGILFYGDNAQQKYGYVTFTSTTTYTVTKSNQEPTSWQQTFVDNGNQGLRQIHNTLLIAKETRGCLFKLYKTFGTGGIDNRVAFAKCLAEFIVETTLNQPSVAVQAAGLQVPVVPGPDNFGGENPL